MEAVPEKVPITIEGSNADLISGVASMRYLVVLIILGVILTAMVTTCSIPKPRPRPTQLVEVGDHFRITLNAFSLRVPKEIGSIATRNEVGSPLAKQIVRLDGVWGRLQIRYYPLRDRNDLQEWYRAMKQNMSFEKRLTLGAYPAIEMRSLSSGGIQRLVVLIDGGNSVVVVSGEIREGEESRVYELLKTIEVHPK